METGIRISVIYTEEYLLQLRVAASNGFFAGRAEVYGHHSDASDFASALRGFPSRADDVREFELGPMSIDSAAVGAKFRFYCVDPVGHSLAEVTLRHDPYRPGGSFDSAVFSIPVESSAVDMFVDQLKQMSPSVGQSAWLAAAA